MILLHDDGDGLHQAALARQLGIDKSNASRLVAQLVKKGHVAVTTSRDDARIKRVRLTAKGARAAQTVDDASRRRFADLLTAIEAPHRRTVSEHETRAPDRRAVDRRCRGLLRRHRSGRSAEGGAVPGGRRSEDGHEERYRRAAAPGFTPTAITFHKTADTIGVAAKKKDRGAVLAALNATLSTCVGCHTAYKQQVVDETTWSKLTSAGDHASCPMMQQHP